MNESATHVILRKTWRSCVRRPAITRQYWTPARRWACTVTNR